MYLVHYNDENGEILKILNTEKHKNLTSPNIPISAQQRNMIVAKPNEFVVDTKTRKLLNVAKPSVENTEEVEAQHLHDQRDSKIRGYVDDSGICWMSDDTALMELNLAINICSLDKKFKPRIHCMVDGVRTLKEVDSNKLLEVAKGIYKIRTSADDVYLQRIAEMKNIVSQ